MSGSSSEMPPSRRGIVRCISRLVWLVPSSRLPKMSPTQAMAPLEELLAFEALEELPTGLAHTRLARKVFTSNFGLMTHESKLPAMVKLSEPSMMPNTATVRAAFLLEPVFAVTSPMSWSCGASGCTCNAPLKITPFESVRFEALMFSPPVANGREADSARTAPWTSTAPTSWLEPVHPDVLVARLRSKFTKRSVTSRSFVICHFVTLPESCSEELEMLALMSIKSLAPPNWLLTFKMPTMEMGCPASRADTLMVVRT
mmetsp:Transcript_62234/g.112104  ORF Transcript_62234/g.112104 Transcript_62234/m.112104 type:complete len:258 (+) Transcript_62234:4918-5691(+)